METARQTNTINKSKIKDMVISSLTAAVLCIAGPLSIFLPFTLVPISVVNLVLYTLSAALGWRRVTAAYIIYLLLGTAGLPVFSGMQGGLDKLLGPTGGYLFGFILIILVTGIFGSLFRGKMYMYAMGMLIGTILCYTFETAWLYLTNDGIDSIYAAVFAGVIPFIVGDIVKIAISCILGEKIRIILNKSSLLS